MSLEVFGDLEAFNAALDEHARNPRNSRVRSVSVTKYNGRVFKVLCTAENVDRAKTYCTLRLAQGQYTYTT